MSTTNTEQKKRQPEHKVRAGCIQGAVWKNESKQGEFFTFDIKRSYKDKEGNWKESHSMGQNDIPKAQLVLSKLFEFALLEQQAKPDDE